VGDPFKRLRATAGLPPDRPAPDPGVSVSKLPPYPGKPAEPAPPKPDREAADAALAKLHEEVGPSEGPPKPLPEAEISKEGLIARTAEYRRPLIDLPLTYGGGVLGAMTPYPGGAAVGAGTGSTIGNVINAYIDSLGGARVDLSPKAIGEDWLINTGANLLTEGAIKSVPTVSGWRQAEQSVKDAERTYGMVMRDRQEYIARTAAEREEAAKKLEQQELEKAAPGFREKALTRATGATPESAGQAAVADMGPVLGSNIEGPTQEEVIKQGGLRGTYYRIRKGTFDTLGKMYDDLMTPLLKTRDVDGNLVSIKIPEPEREGVLQDVRNEFNSQRGYAKETKGRFKGEVPRLFSFTKRLLREDLDDEDFKNIGQAGRQLIDERSGLSELELPPPDPNRPIAGIDPTTGTSITKPAQVKPISRGDLYYMLRMARHAAATAPDAESAKAADLLAKSYEQALEKSGIPQETLTKLKVLNTNYRAAILDFPWEVGDKVSEGKNLIEISDAMFSDPQRAARIFRNASTQERALLKENWGNWGFRNWKKMFPPSAADNPAEAEDLAKAYRSIVGPDSPLAKPKSISFTAAQLQHLEDFPKDADVFWHGVDEQLKTMATDAAKRDAEFGLGLLRKMGPVGADTARAVEAAKTPEEAATIVDEYFNKMSPGYFRKLVGEKERFRGRLVGEEMATGPAPSIKSIGPYTEFMVKRAGAWPWYLMTVGAGVAQGHIGPYWPIILAGSSAMTARRAFQGYLVKAMVSESPMSQAIVSAMSNGAYFLAGNQVAKTLMYQATQHAIKYGIPVPGTDLTTPSIGDPVEPEPEVNPYTLEPIEPDKTSMIDPKNIGPMAKEVERKQATQMASERGRQDSTHVDKVQDLHMQVASGEVPDVHRDLSSGRLSNDEVRQMLADKPRDPSAMFQGMSLADALHAFSLGTDMEKSLSLAALAQKIQNEGQNMKPEQRRAVMAQLQKALGESAA